MDRKSFSTVIDETFNRMEGDVRVLKTQQQTLTINIKDLESKRDKLSEEILVGEKRLAQVNAEYKVQVESILKSAQDKLAKANAKESEAVRKIAELDQKESEARDLISSNQGLQKNLILQTELVKGKVLAFEGLVTAIEETLKEIK